jgi:ribonuclease III
VSRRSNIKELQTHIGHQFANTALLYEALTHSSAAYGQQHVANYERLEFLGDRVLGLSMAEHLFQAIPGAAEGELAVRFNRLVRKETCATVAKEMDLGPHIILGESEAMAGGRRKDTILADACEALLGAIYLDGGWEAAKQFVITRWANQIRHELTRPVGEKDPKTALQEWVQGRGGAKLPRYVLVENSGPDHAPSFVYEVRVDGMAPEKGSGPSRKVAEQAAAAALLRREGVWKTESEHG